MEPTEAFADSLHRLSDDAILQYYNYPLEDELWTHGREYALWVGFPILTFILAQIWVWSLHDLHNAILGWGQSWAMCAFFVELFKRLFGFLRPNYLARIAEYDDDDSEFEDGRKSFPSGHSASSM